MTDKMAMAGRRTKMNAPVLSGIWANSGPSVSCHGAIRRKIRAVKRKNMRSERNGILATIRHSSNTTSTALRR